MFELLLELLPLLFESQFLLLLVCELILFHFLLYPFDVGLVRFLPNRLQGLLFLLNLKIFIELNLLQFLDLVLTHDPSVLIKHLYILSSEMSFWFYFLQLVLGCLERLWLRLFILK